MKNKIEKVVILPIQEPGASMIASGEKKFEFRNGVPKGECGQQIGIVATGSAKKPREVIARAFYGGTYFVSEYLHVSKCEIDGTGSYDECSEANEKLKGQAYSGHYNYPKDSIIKGGVFPRAFAIKLNEIEKFEVPFELGSIGISKTPQKYQYLEYYADHKGAMPSGSSLDSYD